MCCYNLKEIELPNGVKSIGEAAFFMSGINSIIIPSSITSIEREAFRDCSLFSVYITDIVAWCNIKFGENPFGGTFSSQYVAHHLYLNGEEIIDLIIPDNITSIGNSAFYGCVGITSEQSPVA